MKAASSTALFPIAAALLAAACGSSGADGAPGAAGANGADGPAATAAQASTINQITPRIGLLGRELDIRITFDGPAVPTGASLDLGDGVTVDKLTQDGNALVAHVTVPEAAKVGPRDVTVKAGGIDSIVAKKGFVVAAALDLIVSSGAAEQGGLVKLDLSNHDKTWFDDQNFVLLPVSSQSDGTLVQIASSGFTGTDGSVILLGDPLAKTGPLGFMGLNDPSDPSTPTFVSAPDAVTVAARTPEPLTIGTPSAKTLSKPLETAFFSATLTPNSASEGLLVDARATAPAGSTMTPVVFGYPATGKIADLLDQKQDDPGFPDFGIPATQARIAYPLTTATSGYFVVVDGKLANTDSTKLSFALSTYRANIVKESATAHDATPQSLGSLPGLTTSVPGRIVTGELKADGEADVYTFNGLSATTVTDMQISLATDAQLTVLVDTVATFDSPSLVTVSLGGKTGSNVTTGMKGTTRFIKVVAADQATKTTGSYTLGLRRAAN